MKRLSSLALIALISFATPAVAEDVKQSIAVVNIQQIMREATAAKSVREQLESKQKSFQADITKKEEALQKEDQELAKKQSVLSKEAFAEKAKAFRTKATEVQKEVQAKKAMLDNGFERALNDIQKAVNEIIAEMAKEKGFALALPTSQVLYADEKMDISKDVLDRLNKKLPKLDVKFDAK
ncbi:MAG: OmpH family outer membrane protein [Alphaproteobacteria bacterium]|nr:OmpH family outer membrane protein [Alphaproteobacteria bacterium]